MADLQVIVDGLNKPPFNQKLSLVSLDEKDAFGLLSLLNMVVGHISEDQKVDLKQEVPESTGPRIVNFLRLLKYKIPADQESFANEISHGARGTTYTVLTWLLQRLPDMEKRAYLAKFLAPVELPPEFMQDKGLVEGLQHLKDLQNEFIEVHRAVDKARASGFNPGDIQKEIADLEEDKEQLSVKLARVMRKVQNLGRAEANLDSQLQVVRELRLQQEEELTMAEQFKEQRNLLQHSEQQYQRMMDRLREMRSSSTPGDPESIVKRQQEETKMNRYLFKEKLPRVLQEKEAHAQELSKVLSMGVMSEDDLQGLRQQIAQLTDAVTALTDERLRAANNPAMEKSMLYRQQAKMIANKKEHTAERLNNIMEEKSRCDKELEEKERDVDALGARMLQGEEWTRFKANVRTKSLAYKQLSAQVNSLTMELGVVQRTEAILKSRDHDMQDFLDKEEAKKGVRGYTKTQSALEEVTTKRSEVDEMKGATLEEIAGLVKKIERDIKLRSKELEPIVRELRAARERKREVETRWQSAKEHYESVAAGFDSTRIRLEQEIRGFRDECRLLESEYHSLKMKKTVLEVDLKKVRQESTGPDPAMRRMNHLTTIYQKQIEEQQSLGDKLRKQKNRIKQTFEPNMAQISMITDLRKLLKCKLKLVQEQVATSKARANPANSAPQVQDMLVIGDRG